MQKIKQQDYFPYVNLIYFISLFYHLFESYSIHFHFILIFVSIRHLVLFILISFFHCYFANFYYYSILLCCYCCYSLILLAQSYFAKDVCFSLIYWAPILGPLFWVIPLWAPTFSAPLFSALPLSALIS